MVGRIWLAAGTVGAALVLAPAAYAQKPQCPSAKFTGPMNTAISLASLTCTNVSSNFTVNPPSPPPQHGDLSGPPYQYTPKPGFHGTDQFKYTVTDNTTNQTSDPATVDLLIDSAPTCKDLSITTAYNQAVRFPEFPCDDVDDPDFNFFWDDPSHGLISFDDATGDIIYTPAAGFAGTESISYSARDEWGLESRDGTATITVKPAPVAATPVPTPPPPPPDKTAPNAALKTSGKPSLAKGVTLTLTSNEAGTATLTLTVDKATARKLRLDKKAKGPVTVGTNTAALVNGASNVTVKLSSKARKAFKSARQVKLLLTVVVSDAAGNKATKTLVVTIKNPRSRATVRG